MTSFVRSPRIIWSKKTDETTYGVEWSVRFGGKQIKKLGTLYLVVVECVVGTSCQNVVQSCKTRKLALAEYCSLVELAVFFGKPGVPKVQNIIVLVGTLVTVVFSGMSNKKHCTF